MKHIYILLIIISTYKISSQTPGYIGKRFNAGYGFYFSPTIQGSNGAGKSILGRSKGNAEDSELAFNTMHEGYFEYALTKRFSLGISGKYFKTTYDNGLDIYGYTTFQNSSGGTEQISFYGTPNGLYTIKGINYLLYGKLYNRRYIAPWGRYMIFGINIKSFNTIYNPDEMYLDRGAFNSSYYNSLNAPTKFSDFGPLKQHYTKFDILAGFGRTRIVANKIIFDYGFNTNMFSLLTTFFDAIGPDSFIDKVDNTTYIKRTSAFRVRNLNRFNVFIKVGYLF